MLQLLVVGAGGFLGAIARYQLSTWVHRYAAGPYGTLSVNVLGCLAIGVLMAVVERHPTFSSELRDFVRVGLLGSFTTFSALGFEAFEFMREGRLGLAALTVAANLVLGLAAVAAGWALGRHL